jgi:hypothetical protein
MTSVTRTTMWVSASAALPSCPTQERYAAEQMFGYGGVGVILRFAVRTDGAGFRRVGRGRERLAQRHRPQLGRGRVRGRAMNAEDQAHARPLI